MEKLEDFYGVTKKEVELQQKKLKSGKLLEFFENPSKNRYIIEIEFPEFTCRCPRTGYPDFALMTIRYIPKYLCVELKSLKLYLNSFRDSGHFHEAVTNAIYDDLLLSLDPVAIQVVGDFNVRGGTYPCIIIGNIIEP